MRRLVFIAAMIGALAVLPARAQRGGGRGFAGGGSRGGGVMHMATSRPAFGSSPRFHSGVSFHSGGSFHSGVHHGCSGCFHHHHSRAFFPWWGAYGYGYYGYPYSSLWDSSSSYSQDDQYESERYLTRQIDDLNQEVQRLREEQRTYSSPPTVQPESTPAPETTRTPGQSRKDLPTILVFRDQHIQEILNYAISGKNLVVVADHRSTKIPLEKLDLAATARLNDERGVDFEVPR
jgi:hypothetical protein